MFKFLPLTAIIASLAFGLPHTAAHAAPSSKKSAKKAAHKDTEQTVFEDKEEPDTTDLTSSLYNCELGSKLTVYHNDKDDRYIVLRWRNRLHRLTRVDTSTGANRFENEKNGLVWIGIPAKGMLLDSKRGRQLANECKTTQQPKPVTHASQPDVKS
jgi:membrane-bound inhibitor of C-type lysozyme